MHARDSFWHSGDAEIAVAEIDHALPLVIDPGWHDTVDDVDDLFAPIAQQLSPLESESLGSALRAIGRWASRNQLDQVAAKAAPIAGAAVGTAIGGPVGTMAGKAIGDRVAQVAGGATGGVKVPAPVAPVSGTTTLPPNESQAAAKLLYLVQNPAFLSGLVSLALGSRGQTSVPAGPGGAPVRVGALVNLASTLAAKATDDADALAGDPSDDSEAYLSAPSTSPPSDPAVAGDRASALLAFLQSADDGGGEDDDAGAGFDETYDDPGIVEWFDETW